MQILLFILKSFCESFSIKAGLRYRFIAKIEEEGSTLVLNITNETKSELLKYNVFLDKKMIVRSKPVKDVVNQNYEQKGLYNLELFNAGVETILVSLNFSSEEKKNFSKTSEAMFNVQKITSTLKEDYYEALRIAEAKNKIIAVAQRWKWNVWILLLLCPLYCLVSYYSYVNMKSLFSTKRSGI